MSDLLKKQKAALALQGAFRGVRCDTCGYVRNLMSDTICRNCKTALPVHVPVVAAAEQRLAGGIKVGDAIKQAKAWWMKTGREYYRRARAQKNDEISKDPELRSYSILMGKTWDALTKREKYQVVKAWHNTWYHQNIEALEAGKGGGVIELPADYGTEKETEDET